MLCVLPQKLGLPCGKFAFVCTSSSVVRSHVLPISPGDDVLALRHGRDDRYGNTRALGVYIAVHESDKTCGFGPPIGPQLREQKRRLVKSIHRLALDRVKHVGSVVCTPHEVKVTAYLAAERFAGARPDADSRPGWTRLGVARSEIIGKALRSKAFVARSDGGASTGRRYS